MTRRQRFVNAYVGEAAGNATQAAILAGYSARTARQIGSRLLTYVEVRDAVAARLAPSRLTTDKAIAHLEAVAEATIEKVTTGEKLKAIELFLKAKGALHDKAAEPRITVNIGFLQQGQPPTIETVVMPPHPQVLESGSE